MSRGCHHTWLRYPGRDRLLLVLSRQLDKAGRGRGLYETSHGVECRWPVESTSGGESGFVAQCSGPWHYDHFE